MRGAPDEGAAALPVTVTIAASEYVELVECRRELAVLRARFTRLFGASKSWIDRDPEVSGFLAEALGTLTAEGVRTACLSRFGPDRTPSRSAITRFWQRLRKRSRRARR